MLVSLDTKFIGPAEEFHLKFGKRLTILTGDNGLGKSLLLDLAFSASTEYWSGGAVVPRAGFHHKAMAKIAFIDLNGNKFEKEYDFLPGSNVWRDFVCSGETRDNRYDTIIPNGFCNSIILSCRVDGSFLISDIIRSDFPVVNDSPYQSPRKTFSISNGECWKGKEGGGEVVIEGIRRDWLSWKYRYPKIFSLLLDAIRHLSPSNEKMDPNVDPVYVYGQGTTEWPALIMASGVIPLFHASAGVKKILELAYMIVWGCWHHKRRAELSGELGSKNLVVILDEIETHLHPRWQRVILPALLTLADVIDDFQIQFIVTTHSPMVMASLEPKFDEGQDAWYDLDLKDDKVQLLPRSFEKHGDVEGWLQSEAFNFVPVRPYPYDDLENRAASLMRQESPSLEEIQRIHNELIEAFAPTDAFLMRWRYVCEKKGWIK